MKRILVAAALAAFVPLASVAIVALTTQSVVAGENESRDCSPPNCGKEVNDDKRN